MRVEGRTAALGVEGSLDDMKIHSVTTVGRDDRTPAESLRDEVLLNALQGTSSILNHPFAQELWVADTSPDWGSVPKPFRTDGIEICSPSIDLNASQETALGAILSNEDSQRVVLIQGPPGTGKTGVIASAVASVMNAAPSHTLWLLAQSNVAVKNIAEKLASIDFFNFKVLVSKDFHCEW